MINFINKTKNATQNTKISIWQTIKKAGLFSVAILLLSIQTALAGSGIFESYAIVNSTFYDLQNATANPDFAAANLGTFTMGTGFNLGSQIKTFKNGSDNICEGRIYYSIYPASGSVGAFTQINLPFLANLVNPGDQSWELNPGTNIGSALPPGNYKIAVRVGTQGGAAGGCATDPLNTSDNGGNFWIANFTVTGISPITITSSGGTGAPSTGYATMAAAITALNTNTAHTGAVNVFANPGYAETAPVGGYVLTANNGGTSATTIVFNGNGSTYTSPAQASGILHDAVFEVIGSDYITFDNIKIRELSTNTVVASATNTCTEWGIALQYVTTTNGCQNITIKNCDIQLNRVYTNSFGIYQNSTHASAAITVAASATTTAGSNSNLVIQSNLISNVNEGIFILGPTAAADFNNSILIGGATAALGNTITNYGSGTRLSGFLNAPTTTISAIYVRNSIAATIQNNLISSNAGTWSTTATLTGINLPTSSAASAATYTTTISNNTINLTHGITGASMNGIVVAANNSSPTSSIIINANNFTGATNTVALATSAYIGISMTAPYLTTSITNNTWTNISYAASGLFTFCSHSHTMPVGGSETIAGNSIVGTWVRTVAGTGGITGITTGGSSPSGTSSTVSNNNLSNITNIGTGNITLLNQTDGAGTGSNPAKIITNNTFNNITTGTGVFTGIGGNWLNGITAIITSSISNNTITNVTGQGAITGIFLGSNGGVVTTAGFTVNANTIYNLSSTVTGGTVIGINASAQTSLDNIEVSNHTIYNLNSVGASNVTGIIIGGGLTTKVFKNKIYGLSNTNAGGFVNGISVSGGTTPTVYNNIIGDLTAGIANGTNNVIGLSITGGTTVNAYYNTVSIAPISTGATFGSSAVFITSAPTTINLRNNIFVNTGTSAGATGATVAFRRGNRASLAVPNTNYSGSASNNNSFYSGIPSASNLLFLDSTLYNAAAANKAQTLADLKTAVTPRDAASVTFQPIWLSATGSSVNYLHIDGATISPLESGGAAIAGFDDDYDANIRQGSIGYAGAGTSPDMGADEFVGLPIPCSTPVAAVIATSTPARCFNQTVAFTTTGASVGAGYSYQWKVSTTSGSGYANVVGGTGATSTTFTSAPLVAGTYYYILETICNVGPSSTNSNQITVIVNAVPTIVVTPSSAAICNPGGTAVSLTASSTTAISYTWLPITGLTPSNAVVTSAFPAVTTTYTVSGIDAVGCTGTTAITINVGLFPNISAISASPASICAGGTSTLGASSSVPTEINNTIFSTSTGATLDPMTGATTVVGVSVDDAANTTTSTAGPALLLPFSFSLNNVSYTYYSASPDGFIHLANVATAIPDQFTNAMTITINVPKIAPYWEDMATGTDGSVKVLTTGTAPNRIFKVQWFVTIPRLTTGAANSTFQAWLYEGSNKIEYRYGTMGATSTSISAGLSAGAVFQSISFATNTTSTVTANDANTTSPASGRMYTYVGQPVTYSWANTANINGVNNIANPVTNPLLTNTTFTVTVSNGACTATSSVSIVVGAPITSTLSITGATACSGVQSVLATTSGGGTPYTYSWKQDGSSIAPTTASINSAIGTHAYEVTVTDVCGTTTVGSITNVVTLQTPTAVASYNNPVCAGSNLVLTATTDVGTGFAWAGPSYTSTNAVSTIVGATAANSGVYSLTVSEAGCTASTTLSVTINAIPVVVLSASSNTICAGVTNNLLANEALPTYCASTHTSGCSGDDILSLTLNTLVNTNSACALSTSTPPRYLYQSGGLAPTTSLMAGNTYPITLSFGADGNQFFGAWIDYNQDGVLATSEFLGASANAGASGTIGVSFTVPTSAFNGKTRLRVIGGNDAALSASQACGASSSPWGETQDFDITITGGVNNFTYAWMPGSLSGSAQTVSPSTSTIYTVTSTSLAGCTSTAAVSITVNPKPILAVTSSNVTCFGLNNGNISVTSDGTFTITPTSFAANSYPVGVYTITASNANGCTTSTVVTIIAPTAALATSVALLTPIYCFGDNAEVSITTIGGTLPYSIPAFDTVLVAAGSPTYTVTDANGCSSSASITIAQPTDLLLNVSTPTAILCNGGNSDVTVSFSGGTVTMGNYSYGINNGASVNTTYGAGETYSLPAGTYTISVEDDNACIKTQVITITQPNPLVISVSNPAAILCNGGTTPVIIGATGGTAAYTFTKSNGTPSVATSGINNLTAGTWTISVSDANSCSAQSIVTVMQPNALVVSATETDDINCFGGSAIVTVSATGGVAPYTPIGNFSELAASSAYTYTVTDANGCIATASALVSQPTQITASAAISAIALCNGDSATVTVTAGGGTTPYTFGSGTTYTIASAAGAHTYTVTDSKACTISTSITVTQPAVFTSTTVQGAPIACNNGTSTYTVTVAGGTAPFWGGTLTLVGTSKIYTVAAGTYTNVLTDNNGCSVTTSAVTFANPPVLTVDVSANTNPILLTNTLELTATNSNAVSYTWSGVGAAGTLSTSSASTIANDTYTKTMGGLVDYGQYTVTATNATGCTAQSFVNIEQNRDVNVRIKVLLSGPLQSNGLMNASLTSVLPSTTPYQTAPYGAYYPPVGNAGGEMISLGALSNSGDDAIVDWVFLQLRSKTNSSMVVATRSALLQRDGDVVDADGSSDVLFTNVGADDYFVTILHRNHLGIMGATLYNLSFSTVSLIDFTDVSTTLYSKASPNNNPTLGAMNATRNVGGKRALFAGNANISTAAINKYITYNSTIQSDRSALFAATGATGTITGYNVLDVNMDGVARFNGLNPDRLVILLNCFNSNTLILNQQTPN
jgi:GEVED domain